VILVVRISVVAVLSVPLVQALQQMVRHKIVRSFVVATSLVAMLMSSVPRAFLLADEFPPPSNGGAALSPQWDLTTLTVYESNDASINFTVDSVGSPLITAAVDEDADSGTFTFSMVSDDGFESMLVSGEVLADGAIFYQTVKANLSGATSSAGGAAAWAAADSEPGFWDDYWRYLWNPSDMDTDLEVGFYVSAGVGVTAGTVATGGIIYYGPATALPTVFGGAAATAGTATVGVTGAGMTQSMIANAFFHGQTLVQNPQTIAALLWYLQVARDTLIRYQQMGYTGPGVATQTARIQQIIAQLQAWGVPVP
jgi:hypothetical protein